MKVISLSDAQMAAILRALGHPARLAILRILTSKNSHRCCCNDVTECLELAQSTVSQHLKVLIEAGLVESRPQGTRNRYTVCRERLAFIAAQLDGFAAGLGIPPSPPPPPHPAHRAS